MAKRGKGWIVWEQHLRVGRRITPGRVNPRTHTPIPATILIVGGGVLMMVALPRPQMGDEFTPEGRSPPHEQ